MDTVKTSKSIVTDSFKISKRIATDSVKTPMYKRLPLFAVFSLFFIFLLVQYSRIFLYSDDYGYGSLSYVVTTDKSGIAGFFDYLYQHYMRWGGRVLYYSVLILGVKAGLNVIRVIECLILLGGFFFIYKCAIFGDDDKVGTAILTCFFYGSISAEIASQSLYWYSAAITYTLPLFTTVVFWFLLFRKYYSGKAFSTYQYVLFLIFAYIVGFSQEQYAIAGCAAYFVFGIILFTSKKINRDFFFIGAALLLGSYCLLFAPGNFARAGELTDPIYTVVASRLFVIMESLFSQFMKTYMIILLSASVVYSVLKKRYLLPAAYEALVLAVYFIYGSPMDPFKDEALWRIAISYITLVVLPVHIFCIARDTGKIMLLILVLMAVITVLVMVITDQFQMRELLPFQLLTMPIVLWLISDVIYSHKICVFVVILLLCGILGKNMLKIYNGYQKNYEVNAINYEKLKAAANSDELHLTLYKNISDKYSYVVPYMYDYLFKYQEENMKLYFGIDKDVEFEWVDY